jgi:hypothetical protein
LDVTLVFITLGVIKIEGVIALLPILPIFGAKKFDCRLTAFKRRSDYCFFKVLGGLIAGVLIPVAPVLHICSWIKERNNTVVDLKSLSFGLTSFNLFFFAPFK